MGGRFPSELFDFDRDVASITANRWAHGYSTGGPGDSTRIGRRPFGRVTIANADSDGEADAKTAIMMAHRAVNELG
jgi:spermidine dehydrogenase